jgi:hypothetical protein
MGEPIVAMMIKVRDGVHFNLSNKRTIELGPAIQARLEQRGHGGQARVVIDTPKASSDHSGATEVADHAGGGPHKAPTI